MRSQCVCACVCVIERESQRKREIEGEILPMRSTEPGSKGKREKESEGDRKGKRKT